MREVRERAAAGCVVACLFSVTLCDCVCRVRDVRERSDRMLDVLGPISTMIQ